jgi:hypothetical protein
MVLYQVTLILLCGVHKHTRAQRAFDHACMHSGEFAEACLPLSQLFLFFQEKEAKSGVLFCSG